MSEPITVLIVEDHQVTLDGLQLGLSRDPDLLVVATAANSDDGLRLARELKPDVILLDLHLPGESGPRSMVASFCSLPGSKVLVFSAESRMAFIQSVLSMGACGYLLKSESSSKVAQTIKQVMGGRKSIISQELTAEKTSITKSEQEVLRMLAMGMKYQDIAGHRKTSPATVRKQCELLLLKLSLGSREELIAWAVQNGYGSLEKQP